MNKMQKEWLKNASVIIGAILYLALIIIPMLISKTGAWISFILCIPPLVFILGYAIYMPIATFIWHWRLMGACITDEDEELLRTWWFFIKRSECWADYLWKEIQEMKDEEWREGAEDLRTRLMCVKKPKWI